MLIFNFHHTEPWPKFRQRRHLSITPKGLLGFIRLVRGIGFRICSIREVLDAGGPDRLPEKSVLLTFDDGYENNYKYAWPVLEAERCPATIFLLAGKFGGTNDWDQAHLPEQKRDQLMSWHQLKRMAMSPWISFGSHGLFHRNLPELTIEQAHAELYFSHAVLSEDFPEAYAPVFAYPWGSFSRREVEILMDSPYHYAFTTDKSRWDSINSPFTVPRYSIYDRDANPFILLGKFCRHQILFG